MENEKINRIKSILVEIDELNKLNIDIKTRLFIKKLANDSDFLNSFIEKNGEDVLYAFVLFVLQNLSNSYNALLESTSGLEGDDLVVSKGIIDSMFFEKNKDLDNIVVEDFYQFSDQNKINEILNKLKQ